MAVIRPRPQKLMRTAEVYIPREQLNTGRLMDWSRLFLAHGGPPLKT